MNIITTLSSSHLKTKLLLITTVLVFGLSPLAIQQAYGGGKSFPECTDENPVAAYYSSYPVTGTHSLEVSFDGSPSQGCGLYANIVSYEWDFGDGTTGTGLTTSHTFGIGTHTISLTTTDDGGNKNTYGDTTVVVKESNTAPLATGESATAIEGQSVLINIGQNDSDPDNEPIYWNVNYDAQHGSVSPTETPGVYEYKSHYDYSGPDSFTYTVTDEYGGVSETATTTIDVLPGITAVNDAAVTKENTPVLIDVVVNDYSNAGVLFDVAWIEQQPTNGSVQIIDGKIEFTPRANWSGTTAFTYGIVDSDPNYSYSSIATVEVTVEGVNELPVANNDPVVLDEDTTVTANVLANDTGLDPEEAHTVTLANNPSSGTATVTSDNNIIYTPNANFNGTDTLSYSVTDSTGNTSTATVTLSVNPVNDIPTATFTASVASDGKTVTFNASGSADVDGSIVSYSWNFGDGTAATTSNTSIKHRYPKNTASTIVTLVVTDNQGSQSTHSATVSLR